MAAVSTTSDGKPDQDDSPSAASPGSAKRRSPGFCRATLDADVNAVTDGLACFTAVKTAGCTHAQIRPGPARKRPKSRASNGSTPSLETSSQLWSDPTGPYSSEHVPRYLAEFEYRFNRRYRLETMIPRLAYVAREDRAYAIAPKAS